MAKEIEILHAALANVSGALVDAGARTTEDLCLYGSKIRQEVERRDLRIAQLEYQLAICGRAAIGAVLREDCAVSDPGWTRAFYDITELYSRSQRDPKIPEPSERHEDAGKAQRPVEPPDPPPSSRRYDLLAHFFREEGLGWVAHVLHLDLVTYGATLKHAIAMAEEASAEIIADDLNVGLKPFDRAVPPEEFVNALSSIANTQYPGGMPFKYAVDNDARLCSVIVLVSPVVQEVNAGHHEPQLRLKGDEQDPRAILAQE